jgi:hypothetical protein
LVTEVNYLTWDADNAALSASGRIPALHSDIGASGTGSSNPACSTGESGKPSVPREMWVAPEHIGPMAHGSESYSGSRRIMTGGAITSTVEPIW